MSRSWSFLSMFIVLAITAPPTATRAGWSRTYNNSEYDCGRCVVETSDGGYAVCACSGGTWILKTDSVGDTLWTRFYDDLIPSFSGGCMCQTSDGGFIVTGSRWSGGIESDYILVVLKTDSMGNKMWVSEFDNFLADQGYSVIENQDGDYVVAGSFGDSDMGMWEDVWLLKLEKLGDTVWTQRWGYPSHDAGLGIGQTVDEGYIVLTMTRRIDVGYYESWLIKTNTGGDSLWSKYYSERDYVNEGRCLQVTPDGGYVITGHTQSVASSADVWLFKTDSEGAMEWSKIYGRPDRELGWWVERTSDGGFIVIANAFRTQNNLDYSNIWLLRMNAAGDTMWTKTFGNDSGYFNGYSILQTPDQGFVFTGTIDPDRDWDTDVWLVKTEPDGDTLSVTERPVADEESMWEIVTSVGNLILLKFRDSTQDLQIDVFDASGRKVDRIPIVGNSISFIWGEGFRPGVYFVRISSGGFDKTRKVILIK